MVKKSHLVKISLLLCVMLVQSLVSPLVSGNLGISSYASTTEKENLALGKPVIASSYDKATFPYDYMPQKGNDGSASTKWIAATSNDGEYWMVDLVSTKNIVGGEITFEFDDVRYEYVVETSKDKIEWKEVLNRENNTSRSQVQAFAFSDEARYVKITFSNCSEGYKYSFYEFKIFGTNSISIDSTDRNDGNLAKNATVRVGSTYKGVKDWDYAPELAVDGNLSTIWRASTNSVDEYMHIDLGRSKTLTSYEIVWEFDDKNYLYTIETSLNGLDWTIASDKSNNTIKRQVHSDSFAIGAQTVRYVRINMKGLPKESSDATKHSMGIYEFRVYGGEIYSEYTSSPTAAPTATPTPSGYKRIVVFYHTVPTNSNPNSFDVYVDIKNIGTMDINLKDVLAKYWFSRDKDRPAFKLELLDAKMGIGNVNLSLRDGNAYPSTSDTNVYIWFNNGAGIIQPGQYSGQIHFRLYREDWSAFDLNNDYSFNNNTIFVDNPRITGYIDGSLNWGVEPSYIPVSTPTPYPTFSPTPSPTPIIRPTTPAPLAGIGDLAIKIEADKMKYVEDSEVTFKLTYSNKLNIEATNVVIEAQIPKYTTLIEGGDAKIEDDTISWEIPELSAKETGVKVYRVKVGQIGKAEITASNTANIYSDEDEDVPEDNTSNIKVLLYSTRFDKGEHKPYIIGYPDGSFRPSRYVSRAEVAAIMARINEVNLPTSYNKPYKDVPMSHWAIQYIVGIQDLNLFSGYPDGTFAPNKPITRAEFTLLLTKFLKTGTPAPFEVHFNDNENHWAKSAIEEAYRNKLVTGYDDKTFRPDAPIRRDEIVTMMNRLLFRGPLKVSRATFPDVNMNYWAFGDVEESAYKHFYIRDDDGNEVIQY